MTRVYHLLCFDSLSRARPIEVETKILGCVGLSCPHWAAVCGVGVALATWCRAQRVLESLPPCSELAE